MTKPSWDNAPDWARFLALNRSGNWRWHEYEPSRDEDVWKTPGRHKFAGFGFSDVAGWPNSKEARPTDHEVSDPIRAFVVEATETDLFRTEVWRQQKEITRLRDALAQIAAVTCGCIGNVCPICIARKTLGI